MHNKFVSNPYLASFWMFVTCSSFAVMSVMIEMLGDQFHPFQIFFMTSVVGMLILGSSYWRGVRRHKAGDHVPAFGGMQQPSGKTTSLLYLARAALMMGATCFWLSAVQNMPLVDAASISYLLPVINSIAGIVILREKFSFARAISIVLGFLGMILILQPNLSRNELVHILTAFMVPICWCISDVLLKIQTKSVQPIEQTFNIFAYSALLSMAFAAYYWVTPNPVELLWLSLAGVLFLINAYGVFVAYSYGDIGYVASFDFVRLVITATLTYLIYNNSFENNLILGAAIIFLSSIMLVHFEKRRLRINR